LSTKLKLNIDLSSIASEVDAEDKKTVASKKKGKKK